jgi:hypothetical protein
MRQKQAVQHGIFTPVSESVNHVSATCSTGECQWANISSLGICASMQDVSDQLIVTGPVKASTLVLDLGLAGDDLVYNASLPNGVFLIGSTATYNVNISSAAASLLANGSNARDAVSGAIATFFVVYTNQTAQLSPGDGVFRAAQLGLHFCANNYSVVVSGGVSSTSRLASSSADVTWTTAAGRSGSANEFVVDRDSAGLLGQYLASVFSGTYSLASGSKVVGLTAASEVLGTAMYTAGAGSEDDVRAVIGNLTKNVATSMTNT